MENSYIPLEKNIYWWWYKAKINLLKIIITKLNLNRKLNILEIGPGYGNNIEFLSDYGTIDVLEIEEHFLNFLKIEYKGKIRQFFNKIEDISFKYDLIFMLDVLEHIENPKEYLILLNNILSSKGRIIIGVPAYMQLWSSHDVNLKHIKRYNWSTLSSECSQFLIEKRYGFNYLLLPLRFLQIKVFKIIQTTDENGFLINKFLYLFSLIEYYLNKININPKFGLSLYVVLKKY